MALFDFIKDLFSSKKEVTQGEVLGEFRRQYPAYSKVEDVELAKALSTKMPNEYGFLSTYDPKSPISPEVTPRALRDDAFYSQHPEIGQKDALATIGEFKKKFPSYEKADPIKLATALEQKYPDDPQFRGISTRLPAIAKPEIKVPSKPGLPGLQEPEIITAPLSGASESYRNLEKPGKLEARPQEEIARKQSFDYVKNFPDALENNLLKSVFQVGEYATKIPVLPGVNIPGSIGKDAIIAGTLELGGFYKGLFGQDLNIEPATLAAIKERKIDPNIANTAGEIAGGLAALASVGTVLKASAAGDAVLSIFAKTPQVARFLAAGTRAGIEFGGVAGVKEGIRQVKDGELDLSKFGKTVLTETAIGAGFGGVQAATAGRFAKALPDALFQAAGAGAYGFGTSAFMGHDLLSSTISGGVAALYALAGAKDATEAQKLGAFKTAEYNVRNAAEAEATKRGYTPEQAATLAETAQGKFTDFINKVQGEKIDIRNWDKISNDVYSEMTKVFDAQTPKNKPALEGPKAPVDVLAERITPAPAGGAPEEIFKLKPDIAALQEGRKVEAKAVSDFGKTSDLSAAGFMLNNGELLDFSKGTGRPIVGNRNLDHSNISKSTGTNLEGIAASLDFMERTKAIRVAYNGKDLMLQSVGVPTSNQIAEIKNRIIEEKPARVYMDVSNPAGDTIKSEGIDNPTEQDIDRFYSSVGPSKITGVDESALLDEGKVRKVGGLADQGNKPIDLFEKIESPETQQARQSFKLSDRSIGIIRKFAGRVGERYQPRGAVGSFNPNTSNIRVNSLNNISTVTHEVVHYLDDKLGIVAPLLKPVGKSIVGNPIYDSKWRGLRKQLSDIYLEYYPGASKSHPLKLRMQEGLTTLLQYYVQSPTEIKAKYGKLLEAVLNPKENAPSEWKAAAGQLRELVGDVQGIVSDFQKLDPNQQIGARVVDEFRQQDQKLPFMRKLDYVKAENIDDVFPIKRLAQEFDRAGSPRDPSDWIRVYNNVNSIIYSNLRGEQSAISKKTGILKNKHGFWSFENGKPVRVSDKNWRDLEQALNKAGIRERFSNWLIARDQHFSYLELDSLKAKALQALKLLQAGRGLMTSQQIRELKKPIDQYKDLRDQLKRNRIPRETNTKAYEMDRAEFQPYADTFDVFTKAMVRLMGDPAVGLITPEEMAKNLARKGYAPMKRDIFDDIIAGEAPVQRMGGGGSKPSSFKSRKGSELPIVDPLYSFPHDMAEVMRKSLKQIVINKIADIFDAFPQSGLSEPQKITPLVNKDTGQITFPQERDPKIFMARTPQGKRRAYLVNSELKKITDELLDYRSSDILSQLMRGASRLFTAGTTGLFPPFAMMNAVSDQIQAAANSQHKTIPFFDAVKTLRRALLDHDSEEAKFAAEFLALGGERQTLSGALDLPPDEFQQWLSDEKKGIRKFVGFLDVASDILSLPSNISELGTRMTEYIRSRMAGKEYVNALEDAATVTGPFHYAGRLSYKDYGKNTGQTPPLKSLVRGIPFFNAGVQALGVGIESMKGSRGKDIQSRSLFVALASMAAAIGASYWMMKRATDDQKKLYKDLEPQELSGYIWLPAKDGKNLIKIKMHGPQMGIATIINMGLWDSLENTDYTVGDYVAAGTAFLPDQLNPTSPTRLFFSWFPQLVRPFMEVGLNKRTWPAARPLVSESQEKKEPRFQFNEKTPAYAKWLGDKLNLSPIKIDYLIQGYFGRATRPFLGEEVKNPFMREWYFTAGRNIQDYYEQREESNQLWNSYRGNERKFSDKETAQIFQQQGQIRYIDKLLEFYRKVDKDKSVPEKLRNENVSQLRDNILDSISKFRQGIRGKK